MCADSWYVGSMGGFETSVLEKPVGFGQGSWAAGRVAVQIFMLLGPRELHVRAEI